MDGSLLQHYLEPLPAPPDRIAATDGRTALSYGELAVRSSRLAHLLAARGVGRGDRAAVCLRRSPEFLAAILGILKCDAAYVPLDAKSPPERWRRIVDDCTPAVLICDRHTLIPLQGTITKAIPRIVLASRTDLPDAGGEVAATLEDLQDCPAAPPPCRNGAGDLAYVLYTSGSTGQPKGVMITHGNVRNYIDWAAECFDVQGSDRILGTAPFHFDMSTFDLWCALKTGATLCLADDALTLFPEKLLDFMERERVSLWKGIPSLLQYLERAGVLVPGRIPTLTRVLFGGEALPSRTLIRWMETFPEKFFCNVYGPTEATGISLCYPVPRIPEDPGARIPIGRPCKGMQAVLLDEGLQPVGPGETGEMCLAGPGLGIGYLNDAERTSRSFISAAFHGDPPRIWYRTGDLAVLRPDGHFDFVGRKDHQVKVMGYRIELGEIEQALRAVEGVREAAVIAVHRDGLAELVGFLEGEADPAQVMKRLRDRLPVYMLPRRLVPMADLPRCERGKLDRLALHGLALEARRAAG